MQATKKTQMKASSGMVKRATPGSIFLEVFTFVLMLMFLIPTVWAIGCSLKHDEMSLPTAFHYFLPPYTIEHYVDLLTGGTAVVRWLFNSVGIAAVVTFGTLITCAMASYAIAQLNFSYKKASYAYFLIGLMVPGEATIVATFVWVNQLHLINSYAGLILPALAGSMNIIIMSSFMAGIPRDLVEAARIDGAGEFRTFWNVIVPLSKTVMVTVSIFTFIGNWNSYLWPFLCVMNEDLYTLPIGIPTLESQFTIDKTIPMTVNMIASIPIMLFFIIFSKKIVKGISLTGIKG